MGNFASCGAADGVRGGGGGGGGGGVEGAGPSRKTSSLVPGATLAAGAAMIGGALKTGATKLWPQLGHWTDWPAYWSLTVEVFWQAGQIKFMGEIPFSRFRV